MDSKVLVIAGPSSGLAARVEAVVDGFGFVVVPSEDDVNRISAPDWFLQHTRPLEKWQSKGKRKMPRIK